MRQIVFLIFLIYGSVVVAQSTGGYGGGASRTFYTFTLKDDTGVYKGGNGGGGSTRSFQVALEDLTMYAGGNGRGDFSVTIEFGLGGNNQRQIAEEIFTSKNFQVKVQPNPSTNYFTLIVTSGSTEKMQYRVTDILGRILEERIIGSGQIQLGDGWTNGIYFLEIIQGEERKVVRLVKQ